MNKETKSALVLLLVLAILLPTVSFPDPEPVIKWGNLRAELLASGVIDEEKLQAPEMAALRELLTAETDQLVITKENSRAMLNLLWAVGLAQKSPVLEKGPMMDARYGGPENFASTGGWTLARGGAMAHYSQHRLIDLTPEEEGLVAKTARQIYRPCCGNSAYFPDCNHGMAMLGLLELMAASGNDEATMLATATEVNALWFPPLPTGGCAV